MRIRDRTFGVFDLIQCRCKPFREVDAYLVCLKGFSDRLGKLELLNEGIYRYRRICANAFQLAVSRSPRTDGYARRRSSRAQWP